MKLSAIVALFAGLALTIAAPVENAEAVADQAAVDAVEENVDAAAASPKIPGYDQRQSNNAWAIIKQIKAEKFGGDALTACKAAFATALVESSLYIYANKKVPESYKYPYDKDPKNPDADSVGVFQQRAKYYPVAQAMDPAKSAHLFFKKMETVKDWKKAKTAKQIGKLCQKVQVSAYPDRYEKRVSDAAKICKAGKIG